MTIKTGFLITAIFFAIAGNASAQQIPSDSLQVLLAEMAKSNVYETSAFVGFAGSVSLQNQRYERMKEIASQEELQEIASQNNNAVVRLYAFKALVERKLTVPEKLLEKFHQDRSIVKTLHGCLANKTEVRNLIPAL